MARLLVAEFMPPSVSIAILTFAAGWPMIGPTPSYEFLPGERPSFPGSPFTPRLSMARRWDYAAIALLMGLTATLGNALVNVNLAAMAGSSGIYVAFRPSVIRR